MFNSSMETFWPKLIELGVDFTKTSLRIVLIVAVAYVAVRFLRLALNRLETILVRAGEATEVVPDAARKRIRTLMSVLWTIAVGLIWFVVVLTALGQIGVNVGPVLAGAGVVGLAVGFGAQNLVRDLVGGFFLILENHVRVGDVAIINGTGGLVETISFRTIVLRDEAAAVHVFPNGSITTLSNLTKDWSAYVLNIGVAYKEDTDRVVSVMRRVAEEMYGEPNHKAAMLEPIEILGVDSFADSAVTIKARLKTLPLRQWSVGREYRRRLKKAFDAERIEIPFPHRTLYMGETSPTFKVVMESMEGDAQRSNH
ncbi:MAG TPA: mechanosensitive ion channel family protein [Candidatus Binatia bacterium]|nr:mechanosensitive ion channel family protein [Candidatus Binatia bacterium]